MANKPVPVLIKLPLPVILALSYTRAVCCWVLIVAPPDLIAMVFASVKFLKISGLELVSSKIPPSKLTTDFCELVALSIIPVFTTPLLLIFSVPLPNAPMIVVGVVKVALSTVNVPMAWAL